MEVAPQLHAAKECHCDPVEKTGEAISLPCDCWRDRPAKNAGLPVKSPHTPPLLRGDSVPSFLKGDTVGFVVAPVLICTALNDKSTPLLTEGVADTL
jgi:hypothetical protein